MLQTLRGRLGSFVTKVFFGLLLISFAVIGVGTGFRDLLMGKGQSSDAVTVGDTKVSLIQLDHDYRRQLNNIQRRAGPDFVATPAIKQQIARLSLNQEVSDSLFANAAADSGLRISDDLVRATIENQPAFAGLDKQFDRGRFQMALQNQGLTETGYAALVRQDLARQMLVAPVAGSAIVSKSLVADMYRYQNEQRVAETILIANSAAPEIGTPTDADLQAYHQKHAAEFTLPEYRSFTVLAVTPELFMGEITPTDDELHAAYEAHKGDYVVAEKRKIEQVVVPDEATAKSIANAAQVGKSLADAAKAATGGKAQPVALDFTARDQFPDALRDPVFQAAKDATVGPIQSPLGWHVLRVADIEPGHDIAFDEVKPKLETEVKRDNATDKLAEQVDKLGDKLLGGAPVDQVAASVGATPIKAGPVDAEDKSPPGADVSTQTKPDPAWVAASFKLAAGETSPFQDDKNGGYFAVRVDGIVPPVLRSLADVRADVVAGWTAEQRANATAKRADELLAKVRAGTPMNQIASDINVKLDTTGAVTRDRDPALFQMGKVGDVAAVPTADGVAIERLTEIRAVDPTAAGVDLEPLKRALTSGLQKDELVAYEAALRRQYKVSINPSAVETVAGQ